MSRRIRIFLIMTLTGFICYFWGYFSLRNDFFPSSLIHLAIDYFRPSPRLILSDAASGGKRVGTSSQIDLIRSLPYLGLADKPTGEEAGVRNLDPERVYPGYTLYTTGLEDEAYLIDNNGRLVHFWRYPRENIIWKIPSRKQVKYRGWRSFYAFKNLDLLVIYDYLGLARIDKKSRLIWAYKGGCHHDLWVTPKSNIYVLGSQHEVDPYYNHSIIADYIIILDSSGRELRRIRLLTLILNSRYRFLLPSPESIKEPYSLDILHANSIQVLDGQLQELDPVLFREGNILVSVRNLSTIFVVDLEKQEIIWAWGPTNVSFQHKARLLSNGNILMFDNGLKRSRIIELNPVNQNIVWQYSGREGEDFFRIFMAPVNACQMEIL